MIQCCTDDCENRQSFGPSFDELWMIRQQAPTDALLGARMLHVCTRWSKMQTFTFSCPIHDRLRCKWACCTSDAAG